MIGRTISRGFTLLEIVIVIIVLATLMAVITGAFSRFNQTQALRVSAEEVVSLLAEARALTLASKGGFVYGVHFATRTATLFQGATFVPNDPSNEEFELPDSVHMLSASISGGGDVVVFERLSGKTSENGTVTFALVADVSRIRVITIDGTGLTSVE